MSCSSPSLQSECALCSSYVLCTVIKHVTLWSYVPLVSPIRTKFGTHLDGNKAHRHNFFRMWEIPLTSKISIFHPNFQNSYLENGPRFFSQIFGICRPSACPQNEILKSGVGPKFGRGGGSNF